MTSGVISKARTPSSKQNTVCRPTRHDTTNTNYIQFFKALMGLVVMYSGLYGKEPGLIKANLIERGINENNVTPAEIEAACRKEMCACSSGGRTASDTDP